MKKLFFLLFLLWPIIALEQSTPGFVYKQVPTAAQWNGYFGAKQDYNPTLTSLGVAGCTFASPCPLGSITPNSGTFTWGSFGSINRGIYTITTPTYSPLSSDTHLIVDYGGTVTLDLQNAYSPIGREFTVRTIVAQTVNSNASNVVPCAGGAAGVQVLSPTAGKWVVLVSDGTNWQIQMCN